MDVIEYQELTVRARDFEGEYSDYWNQSSSDDGLRFQPVLAGPC